MDALISPEALAGELGTPGLRILDATALMPGDPRDLAAEFDAAHIPGAQFLALASLADPNDARPMMLPDAALVSERLQLLGVNAGDRIVIYDNSAMASGARAWWMLSKVYGVPGVQMLNGGMQAWIAEGRPTESGARAVPRGSIAVTMNRNAVRTKAEMLANISSVAEQVADARGALRFTGTDPEPRPGMASGHIPGAVNLPYSAMFDDTGRWKDEAGLRAAFAGAGINLDKPLVTTCGSGVTASVLALGAELLGKRDVALYDGSWSEWGMDPDMPKAVGV
jgi:thiosulfate/3-mercaptopyruvate sulfurtransferase